MTGERDRFVDLLRAGSMALVVVGHWLVADIRWDGERLVETSALAEAPSLWPLSWLVLVIALFFFVGGFSNARSWRSARRRGDGYAAFVDRRTHRMLVPFGVYVAATVPLALLIVYLRDVSDLSLALTQPLWFLGVYLLAIGLTPVTLGWHDRWGSAVPVVLLLAAVVVDIVAFGAQLPGIGYLNAVIVWVLVHQMGYFYADGTLGRGPATGLAVGGWSVALLLTQADVFPYSSFMVGVTGVDRGNMHPPTVALMAVALGAIGTAMLLRPVLLTALDRPALGRMVVRANLSVLTVYLWHQTALLVAARLVLPLGYPSPAPGSAAWWAARLVWLLVPAAILAIIVAVVGRAERVPPPSPAPSSPVTTRAAAFAVVLMALGLLALAASPATLPFDAVPGLGPVRVSVALGLALIGSAWWMLVATRRGARATRGATLGAAGVLGAAAAAYAIGAGPFPAEPVVAWTSVVFAGAALVFAAWTPGQTGPDMADDTSPCTATVDSARRQDRANPTRTCQT